MGFIMDDDLYIINGMDLSEDEVLGISDDVFGGFVGLEDYGWDVEKFALAKLGIKDCGKEFEDCQPKLHSALNKIPYARFFIKSNDANASYFVDMEAVRGIYDAYEDVMENAKDELCCSGDYYDYGGVEYFDYEIDAIRSKLLDNLNGIEDYGRDVEKFVRDKLRLQSHEASSKLDQINLQVLYHTMPISRLILIYDEKTHRFSVDWGLIDTMFSIFGLGDAR